MCTANWARAAPELRLDILCRRLEIFGMPRPHGIDQLLPGQLSKRVSRAGVRKHRKGPQHHSQAPDLKIQDPHVLKAKADQLERWERMKLDNEHKMHLATKELQMRQQQQLAVLPPPQPTALQLVPSQE